MVKDKFKNFGNFAKILQKILLTIKKITEHLNNKIHQVNLDNNMKQRIITSLMLAPLVLYAIFFSENLFFLLIVTITILMTTEWLDIVRTAKNQKKWRLIGFFYVLIPIYSVIKIRLHDSDVLFWMFAVIWATDIFAFFAGKNFGGTKLAPKISPNKTWSGLFGGLLASAFIGFLSSFMFSGSVAFFVFASAILAVVEQISDLIESKVKRIFGVKDSGNTIPGHGGVIDRLDGLMLVAPAVLVLITIFPEKFVLA